MLEALAVSREPRGVTELANELGMLKSNVHRLIQTLAHRGYVRRASTIGRYECTLKIWELGAFLAERLDVRRVSRPYAESLARQTSEAVHLSVLDLDEVVYIDKIDSPEPVRAYSRVGGRAPAYCVATGKALLAYVPEEVLAKVCANLKKHTARTITDPDTLKKEMRRVRELGYAINRGEWRATVCGLGAPIFDINREVVAAIGISGPIERLGASRIREFAPLVAQIASAISSELGFVGTIVASPREFGSQSKV